MEKQENWKQMVQNICHGSDELRVCLFLVYQLLKIVSWLVESDLRFS